MQLPIISRTATSIGLLAICSITICPDAMAFYLYQPSPVINSQDTPVNSQPQADQLLISGNKKFKQKDYAGAIADFSKSIELSPRAAVYHNRGMSYASEKNYEKAVAIIKDAEDAFVKDVACPDCKVHALTVEEKINDPLDFWGKLKNQVLYGQTSTYSKNYRCTNCKHLFSELPLSF